MGEFTLVKFNSRKTLRNLFNRKKNTKSHLRIDAVTITTTKKDSAVECRFTSNNKLFHISLEAINCVCISLTHEHCIHFQ